MKYLFGFIAVVSAIVIAACLSWAIIVSLVTFGGALAGGATVGGAFSAVGLVLLAIIKLALTSVGVFIVGSVGYRYFNALGAK